MATWKEFDNKGGVLKWKEKNDYLINNGEDFVCYAAHPVNINLDVVVGEVEVLTWKEYQRECPNLRYISD